MDKTIIGVIGCGNISDVYLANLTSSPEIEVAAVADLEMARAAGQAAKYGIESACTAPELLADPAIELVVNLTVPSAHAEVAAAILEAGKSAYSEKPLAIEREDARRLLDMAVERGLRVGCAPDTFLGEGLQTARKLLDDGVIGRPVGAAAFMLSHGPEGWHPSPDFFYQRGGGPLFDVGPYYLTALINLLGPVRRVTGSTQISFQERVIGSEVRRGEIIHVETPTHISSTLDFGNDVVAIMVMSFDVWASGLPHIEIYGSEGTLSLPDPNQFGGTIRLWRATTREWEDVPTKPEWSQRKRGLGVADMVRAMRQKWPHRANGEMAYHVVDIMHAIHDASAQGHHVELASSCSRPRAMHNETMPV